MTRLYIHGIYVCMYLLYRQYMCIIQSYVRTYITRKRMYIYAAAPEAAAPTVFMGLATGPVLRTVVVTSCSAYHSVSIPSEAPSCNRNDRTTSARVCHNLCRRSVSVWCHSASDAWFTDWLGCRFLSGYFGCPL